MKILCETRIVHRLHNKVERTANATLVLGFSSGAKDLNGNVSKVLEIMHFSKNNKLGKRYMLKDNIQKLFTRFIMEGKATMSFKDPPEDLMIKCNTVQLKAFLHAIKLGLDGKSTVNLKPNIAAATPIPTTSMPVLKLSITKPGDLPVTGLPKTLTNLTISCKLAKVTSVVFSLKNLSVLNLSCNEISEVPIEVGDLPLVELIFNNNNLGETKKWAWLERKTLQRCLRHLDLSANNLMYMPVEMLRLEQLVTLRVNNNVITFIPFGISRLRKLRYLYMSSNRISALPSCLSEMPMEVLDICDNFRPEYDDKLDIDQPRKKHGVLPLWVLAARTVCIFHIPYTAATIPRLLVDIIAESPKCFCGRLCDGDGFWQRWSWTPFPKVKSFVFDPNYPIFLDMYLCGPLCLGHKQARM